MIHAALCGLYREARLRFRWARLVLVHGPDILDHYLEEQEPA